MKQLPTLIMKYLLRFTIGAAVPRYIISGTAAGYRTRLGVTDMALKEEDEDVVQLIDHGKGLEVTTPEMTDYICRSILRQCGGHVYPTLAIIEGYFTTEGLGDVLQDKRKFCEHFYGPGLEETRLYRILVNRCFLEFEDELVLENAHNVLSCRSTDISTLRH